MENNTVKVKHPAGKRYEKILSIIATTIPKGLADREIDIIASFLRHGGDITTQSRKEVCTELGITIDYLGNYLKKLRAKKVFINDKINPSLNIQPFPDELAHVVSFILEAEEAK